MTLNELNKKAEELRYEISIQADVIINAMLEQELLKVEQQIKEYNEQPVNY